MVSHASSLLLRCFAAVAVAVEAAVASLLGRGTHQVPSENFLHPKKEFTDHSCALLSVCLIVVCNVCERNARETKSVDNVTCLTERNSRSEDFVRQPVDIQVLAMLCRAMLWYACSFLIPRNARERNFTRFPKHQL